MKVKINSLNFVRVYKEVERKKLSRVQCQETPNLPSGLFFHLMKDRGIYFLIEMFFYDFCVLGYSSQNSFISSLNACFEYLTLKDA